MTSFFFQSTERCMCNIYSRVGVYLRCSRCTVYMHTILNMHINCTSWHLFEGGVYFRKYGSLILQLFASSPDALLVSTSPQKCQRCDQTHIIYICIPVYFQFNFASQQRNSLQLILKPFVACSITK